jgi:hypothetical protein
MDGGDGGDDEVGYGKPPKKHQFQKGHSGKGGRPRGSKSESVLDRVLGKQISVNFNGRRRKAAVDEVLLTQMSQEALAGDKATRLQLIKLRQAEEARKAGSLASVKPAKIIPPLPQLRFSTHQTKALVQLGALVEGYGREQDKIPTWLAIATLKDKPQEAWASDEFRKLVFHLYDPIAVIDQVPALYRDEWIERAAQIAKDRGLEFNWPIPSALPPET